MARIERVQQGVLVGTVQGFVPDGKSVQRLLDEERPDVVALGVPPEDLQALQVLAEAPEPKDLIGQPLPDVRKAARPAVGAPGPEAIFGSGQREMPTPADDSPFASLDPVQERFLGLLARFGDVAVPSPDLSTAFAWAQTHGAIIEPLDLDDEAHAEVYIRANRLRDVWRSGRIQKRLAKEEFSNVTDSDGLALAWDDFQNDMESLRKVEAAREEHMAQRIRELAPQRLVAVVPVARLAGIAARLRAGDPS